MRSSITLVFAHCSCSARFAVGCKSGKADWRRTSRSPAAQHSDFPDAIRLYNGTVNLIIVPSLGGRIMRYGYVGGPNVLWNNPKTARPPQAAATCLR